MLLASADAAMLPAPRLGLATFGLLFGLVLALLFVLRRDGAGEDIERGRFFSSRSGCGSGLRGSIWSRMAAL